MNKYNHIFLPVKKQLNLSMLLASCAQLIKLSIWLMMVWIVYALMQGQQVIPYVAIVLLLLMSVAYYTLRIRAHDVSHYAAFKLEEIIREKLAKTISKLPIETARREGSGNLTKTLIDDVKELHVFVADAPPLKAEAFITPIFTIIVLLAFDWVFGLIVLLITLCTFIFLSFFMQKGRLSKKAFNQATVSINSAIIEYVQGMNTVRTFDAGEGSYSRYKQALEHYNDLLFKWLDSVKVSSKLARSLFAPMPMLMCLLLGFSIAHVYFTMPFITVFCFLLLAVGIAESLHPYLGLYQLLEKSRAAIERIFEIENLPILVEPTHPQSPANHHIRFQEVEFSYEGSKPILTDINLNMPQHSFSAIIGASGSGKTTLANLLPRFLEVKSGAIMLGDVNIKDMSYADLMSRISFVFQDNFLFSCSIADNIRYGLDGISLEEVIAAAKKAEIHDFIMTLNEQYETKAGERGQLLSGGQKQRIAIARAFLQDRPIVILDEPTAFSDAKNEALLLKAFNRLIDQQKTIIMIAHRLSSVVNADQIVFLDQGRIIAQGHHADLMATSAAYQKLWQDYQTAQSWAIPTQAMTTGAE